MTHMPPELLNDGVLSKVKPLETTDCTTLSTTFYKLSLEPIILTVLFSPCRPQTCMPLVSHTHSPYHDLHTP